MPMVEEGRSQPFARHGKTVYLTTAEYWLAYLPMIGGIVAGLAGGVLWKKISAKKDR